MTRVDATSSRPQNLNDDLASFGSEPRHRPALNIRGGARASSDFTSEMLLRRFVEADPSSAVIEERNRMAREIHDTLAQEFAGILLHLEAANSSYEAKTASECLARARELAKCGLEDARRMLLGL